MDAKISVNMARFLGELVLNDEDEICLRMKIAPQNPKPEDIELKELFEEFLNKRVVIDMTKSTTKWEV